MTCSTVIPSHQVGWCYSQSGTPVVYIMALDAPSEADMLVPMDNWWNALRFAMSFAWNNPQHEFVGGPVS